VLQFTSHSAVVCRSGTANAIKEPLPNCVTDLCRDSCFDAEFRDLLLSLDKINLLPYLLLVLCTSEEFPDEDSENLPAELQLLPKTHKREESNSIIFADLESLLLLTTTLAGQGTMRKNGVYVVI
jgi:hypothetical protein